MTTYKTWSTVMVLALAVIGCDEDDAFTEGFGEGGPVSTRAAVDNGLELNGMRINGMRINGMRINGDVLHGNATSDAVKMVGMDLPGPDDAPADVSFANGSLQVHMESGAALTDWELADTLIKLQVTEAGVTRERELRLEGVSPLNSQQGVWLFDVDQRDAGQAWTAACTDGAGQPTEGILLGDVWDPKTGAKVSPRPSGALTFACRGAALAKCVEFGYVPWKLKGGVSLADYHQACTRMVRADYCGDGQPHTVNGTKIHVLDQIGVQNKDPYVKYAVEAEWGPNGAVCLNPGNTRLPNQSIGCQIPTCGSSFASGGLIQSGKITSL